MIFIFLVDLSGFLCYDSPMKVKMLTNKGKCDLIKSYRVETGRINKKNFDSQERLGNFIHGAITGSVQKTKAAGKTIQPKQIKKSIYKEVFTMAHKMKVLQALRPRIIYGDNADMGEAVNYIADRTGANEGEANLMLKEVRDTIIFFNRSGRAVVIEGLGTFRPNVKMDGSYNIVFKMDKVLKNRLNTPGEDKMRIVNKDNIGKSIDEIYAIWNEANPDDPVEL
jgi:hypothetical protein